MAEATQTTQKHSSLLIDQTLFIKLSPLQQKIILELSSGPLQLSQLSEKTNCTVHTIGKQLSLLQFKTKYNSLHRKGIRTPLIKKNKDPGLKTTYSIISK